MSGEKRFKRLFGALCKRHGLKVRAKLLHTYGDILTVRLTATSGTFFEYWRGARSDEEMPADHPMHGQYGDCWRVNGDTNYITRLDSPIGRISLNNPRARGPLNQADPWCLRSNELTATVYLGQLLAEESAQEDFVSLIQDLQRKDGRWVSVSGGFKSR